MLFNLPVSPISKTGTLKLHWKPAQAEPPPVPSLRNKGTFWHKLDLPQIDAKKLVQLFEQKTKEVPAVKVRILKFQIFRSFYFQIVKCFK